MFTLFVFLDHLEVVVVEETELESEIEVDADFLEFLKNFERSLTVASSKIQD